MQRMGWRELNSRHIWCFHCYYLLEKMSTRESWRILEIWKALRKEMERLFIVANLRKLSAVPNVQEICCSAEIHLVTCYFELKFPHFFICFSSFCKVFQEIIVSQRFSLTTFVCKYLGADQTYINLTKGFQFNNFSLQFQKLKQKSLFSGTFLYC